MLWILSLCLLLMGVRLSTQDMVTMAPSEPTADPATTEAEAANLKPTIRALHITSDIKYRYATTLVSSRVVNPSSLAGEAAFTVTLPDSAFISEFLMEIKGKVYKAYVKDKEEAKALYDRARDAGQFAGHVALDARDSNQFTVSVNIEAQGKVTFNLTYEQLLPRALGVYTNVISINPQQIVDDMSITVSIEEPTAITKLDVPEIQVSNEVFSINVDQNTIARVEEISPKHKQVIWAPTPEQQKTLNATGVYGQFLVKYDVDHEENPQNILVDEGYFVHFFAPENLPKLKKHVVFVLDYSRSMLGRKIQQLRNAMNTILSDLDPSDYFSIVVFHSYIETWSPNKTHIDQDALPDWDTSRIPSPNTVLDRDFIIEASTRNIDSARSFLNNYSDFRATNILEGLRSGLKLVKIGSDQWVNESDAPHPIMVFLTDGQPFVGELNTDVILTKTKDMNVKQCPIYSLAFGDGADFNFLRKLSLSNYGFARNIYEAADASEQLKNFYKTVASPLLSNVTFNYLPGQVDNSSNTKKSFPAFFKGSELVVAGKINEDTVKDKDTIGELRGVSASGLKTYPIVINMTKSASVGHLEKTWAYLTIKQLLDKADSLDNSDEKNKTKEKAKELALQYSFVTPLTSLVVVKPNETESAVDTTRVKPGATSTNTNVRTLSGGGLIGTRSSKMPPPVAYRSGGYQSGDSDTSFRSISGTNVRTKYGQGLFDTRSSYRAGRYQSGESDTSFRSISGGMYSPRSDSGESYSSNRRISGRLYSPRSNSGFPRKISYEDITWLRQLTSGGPGNFTVRIQGQQFKLGLGEFYQSFGHCYVDNEDGECHHFHYCAWVIFKDNLSDFIPYRCPIPGNYLGVCCPESVLP